MAAAGMDERDDQQDGRQRHAGRRTAQRGDDAPTEVQRCRNGLFATRSLRDVRALAEHRRAGLPPQWYGGPERVGTGGARVRRRRHGPWRRRGRRPDARPCRRESGARRHRAVGGPVRSGAATGRTSRPPSPMWSLAAGAREPRPSGHADSCRQQPDHPRPTGSPSRDPPSPAAPGRGRPARRLAVPRDVARHRRSCPMGRPSVAETADGRRRLGLRDRRAGGVPDHRRRPDRRDHRHGGLDAPAHGVRRASPRRSAPIRRRDRPRAPRRPPPPRAGPRPVRDPRVRGRAAAAASPATWAAAGRSATSAAVDPDRGPARPRDARRRARPGLAGQRRPRLPRPRLRGRSSTDDKTRRPVAGLRGRRPAELATWIRRCRSQRGLNAERRERLAETIADVAAQS